MVFRRKWKVKSVGDGEKSSHRYLHGGEPGFDMARLGVPEKPLVDFSVNINCLGMPEIVRRKWSDLARVAEKYPSVQGNGIADYCLRRLGLPKENVIPGNGSTELIYLIPRVLCLEEAVVVTPSYHDYTRACELAGTRVKPYPLAQERGFAFPKREALAGAIKGADALWVGRPNNPTGGLIDKETVLDLASRFPEKWFIIDEAFIQFVDRWEEIGLVSRRPEPNILVIFSLTKFYSLAGIRMGGVIGSEGVITKLKKQKEPWTVNAVAEEIAPLLAYCADYEEKSRILLENERERLFNGLCEVEGIDAFPFSANFVLCRWDRGEDLDNLIRYLLLKGIYIRDCRNFPGLEDNFFRIAVMTREDNDRLVSALSSY